MEFIGYVSLATLGGVAWVWVECRIASRRMERIADRLAEIEKRLDQIERHTRDGLVTLEVRRSPGAPAYGGASGGTGRVSDFGSFTAYSGGGAGGTS